MRKAFGPRETKERLNSVRDRRLDRHGEQVLCAARKPVEKMEGFPEALSARPGAEHHDGDLGATLG